MTISLAEASARHPCFNPEARAQFGRIHLPVAPRCKTQCNFCNRKFSCANESRPGVTTEVQTPKAALEAVSSALDAGLALSVVGIAGPGDPLANPEQTLETLRLVKEQFPELLLCVSTNGIALLDHADSLAELGVSHLTLTMNAGTAQTAAQVYRWGRHAGKTYTGEAGGHFILERQKAGLAKAAEHPFVIKINTVIVPGVNDHEVPLISEVAAGLGASLHNCIPMIPVAKTAFAGLPEPSSELMLAVRQEAARFLPQMTHCTRCRADACGLLEKPGEGCGTAGSQQSSSPALVSLGIGPRTAANKGEEASS